MKGTFYASFLLWFTSQALLVSLACTLGLAQEKVGGRGRGQICVWLSCVSSYRLQFPDLLVNTVITRKLHQLEGLMEKHQFGP